MATRRKRPPTPPPGAPNLRSPAPRPPGLPATLRPLPWEYPLLAALFLAPLIGGMLPGIGSGNGLAWPEDFPALAWMVDVPGEFWLGGLAALVWIACLMRLTAGLRIADCGLRIGRRRTTDDGRRRDRVHP